MPVQFKNVINFFPVTAAREMTSPSHKLKLAAARPTTTRCAWRRRWAGRQEGLHHLPGRRVRLEVFRGRRGRAEGERLASPRRPPTSAAPPTSPSQVARMKAAGCDMVVLGTIIRETIGTIAEGRKTGFNPVPRLQRHLHRPDPQARQEGDGRLYAAHGVQHPYLDEASPKIQFWANKTRVQRRPDGLLGLRLPASTRSSPRRRRPERT